MRIRAALAATAGLLLVLVLPGSVASTTWTASWWMEQPSGATWMTDSSGSSDGRIGSRVRTGVPYEGGRGYAFAEPPAGTADRQHLVLVPDAPALDPGARTVLLRVELRTTDRDANVLLKGQAGTAGGRYKLEITNGYAACQFQGHLRTLTARWPHRVDDGRAHVVTCQKTADRLRIAVDGAPAVTAWGQIGRISNAAALSIGGKSDCNGQSVGCDYFTGTLGSAALSFS